MLAEADMDVAMALRVLGIAQTQLKELMPRTMLLFKVRGGGGQQGVGVRRSARPACLLVRHRRMPIVIFEGLA